MAMTRTGPPQQSVDVPIQTESTTSSSSFTVAPAMTPSSQQFPLSSHCRFGSFGLLPLRRRLPIVLCLLVGRLRDVVGLPNTRATATEAVTSAALPHHFRYQSRKAVEEDLEPPPKDGPTLYVGGGGNESTTNGSSNSSGPFDSNSTNPTNDDDGNPNSSNWIYCPQVYMPVYCTLGGLPFSNLCEATAEGYTPDNCTVEWESPDLDQGMALQTQCSNDTAILNATTLPALSCGGTASYPSVCWASAAGWFPADECTDASNTTSNTLLRLEPFPYRCAFKAARPLRCGGSESSTSTTGTGPPSHNRTFVNLCFARAQGFRRVNCTRTTDSPDPTTIGRRS